MIFESCLGHCFRNNKINKKKKGFTKKFSNVEQGKSFIIFFALNKVIGNPS